jgi:RNA polymerase sigma-70 factor (ECF subfamily)
MFLPASVLRQAALCLAATVTASMSASAAELELPHVHMTYDGIEEAHARAIARTVAAARTICADKCRFEMPETIHIDVSAKPEHSVRLFNDGVDRFSLSLRSERDLRKPSASGTFHLYGLCHEVGHLAMYRPIKDHSWLSTAGAEGWAHHLGSALVDEVFAKEGMNLWPDTYDYRLDGTKRLDEQLARPNASEVAHGARLWRDLASAVGPEKIPAIFAAWGRAKVDPSDPAATLRIELTMLVPDADLESWWKEAASLLLVVREASRFAKLQIDTAKLTGSPRALLHDDGESAGKSSIAGGGHAVRFRVPDGSWFMTAVEIYGSRYGAPAPPDENFHVWLCDGQMRAVADFEFPYAKFERGEPKWVKLAIDPTNVPTNFIVCVGFNPAATKGVFVHYDGKSTGNSITGLPGAKPREFPRGDWMIRVHVDQSKDADALSGMP